MLQFSFTNHLHHLNSYYKNIHIDQELGIKGPHSCLTFSQHDQTRYINFIYCLHFMYSATTKESRFFFFFFFSHFVAYLLK